MYMYLHRATGSLSNPGVAEIKRSNASGLFNILSICRKKKYVHSNQQPSVSLNIYTRKFSSVWAFEHVVEI